MFRTTAMSNADVIETYQKKVRNGHGTFKTHLNMLIWSADQKNKEWLQKAFDNALQKDQTTSHKVLYDTMITAASRCGAFDIALRVFSDAIKSSEVGEMSGAVIDMLFEDYKKNVMSANDGYHIQMLRMLAHANRVDLLKNLKDPAYPFNVVIKGAEDNDNIELAWEFFQLAVKNKFADVITYTSMIKAAGKAVRHDYAIKAYEQASAEAVTGQLKCAIQKRASASKINIIHNTMITAMGRCADVKKAQLVYAKLCKSKLDDMITHTAMIVAAGNSKCPELLYQAYNNALMSGKINDEMTHCKMMLMAAKNGRRDWIETAHKNALKRLQGKVSQTEVAESYYKKSCEIYNSLDCTKKSKENNPSESIDSAYVQDYKQKMIAAGKLHDMSAVQTIYINAMAWCSSTDVIEIHKTMMMIATENQRGDLRSAAQALLTKIQPVNIWRMQPEEQKQLNSLSSSPDSVFSRRSREIAPANHASLSLSQARPSVNPHSLK